MRVAAGMKSAWSHVATIALMYDVPIRGYLPQEIIIMIKAHPHLRAKDVETLKELCEKYGWDYDRLLPRYWIKQK